MSLGRWTWGRESVFSFSFFEIPLVLCLFFFSKHMRMIRWTFTRPKDVEIEQASVVERSADERSFEGSDGFRTLAASGKKKFCSASLQPASQEVGVVSRCKVPKARTMELRRRVILVTKEL